VDIAKTQRDGAAPKKGIAFYKLSVGTLEIGWEGDKILSLRISETDNTGGGDKTPLTEAVYAQIAEYLAGKRRNFDFPYEPRGTAFQRQVWERLLQIPYGETASYGEIAALIGKPGAARAVGAACGANPLIIVVPCHRVKASGGGLGGYSSGLPLKKILLELEKGADITV